MQQVVQHGTTELQHGAAYRLQTDREQLKLTLNGDGFEAGQEYTFAIREYG